MEKGKDIGMVLLAGLLAGALFAFMARGPLFAMLGFSFSIVPIIAAGLSFGASGIFMAAAVGFLVVTGLTSGSASSMYVIWDLLPSLLLVLLLLRSKKNVEGKEIWYPLGYALSWVSILTALIGALSVVMIIYFYEYTQAIEAAKAAAKEAIDATGSIATPVIEFSLPANVEVMLKKVLRETAAKMMPNMSAEALEDIGGVASLLMALTASVWFMKVAIGCVLADFIVHKTITGARPSFNYTSIYVQNWVLGLIAVAFIIGTFSQDPNVTYFAFNFAAAVSLPLCVLGLSRVHIWAQAMPYPNVILTIFYTLLSLAFFVGVGIIEVFGILAVIGLYEQIVRIYKRYLKSDKNGGK